ncbi:hypothetical protein A0H81_02449 [Grifola frondosa]|uniref:Uncharacterized protein n=1 Tax=Grifola frondosa TaxID=5627 RepID=A0A1C7MN46_GRIFR|nr:hypothetical protein A0H81_02449 [Grifola frondosa]
MFLIAIWIETFLYDRKLNPQQGINFIVFSGAVYVLAFKKRRTVSAHRYLLGTSVLLFAVSTAHIALSLRQLMVAFLTPSIILAPQGASIYFATQTYSIAFVKQALYVINDVTQNMILVRKSMSPPFRLPITQIPRSGVSMRCGAVTGELQFSHLSWNVSTSATCSFIAIVSYWRGASPQDASVKAWGIAAWTLLLVINIGVTIACASKIWLAGRRARAAHPRGHNVYLGVAYTILESGGLFAAATLVVVIMYLNTPSALDALAGVNALVQLATLCPLLIVVRIGLGLTHGKSCTDAHMSHGTQLSLGPPRFVMGPVDSVQVHIHQTQEDTRDSFVMEEMKSQETA